QTPLTAHGRVLRDARRQARGAPAKRPLVGDRSQRRTRILALARRRARLVFKTFSRASVRRRAPTLPERSVRAVRAEVRRGIRAGHAPFWASLAESRGSDV